MNKGIFGIILMLIALVLIGTLFMPLNNILIFINGFLAMMLIPIGCSLVGQYVAEPSQKTGNLPSGKEKKK